MAQLRLAVVGGGLTGLAAAHRLGELAVARRQSAEIVLFEAGSRLGGVIETRPVKNYTVEMGADSFITNKPWALDLCKRLGLESRLMPTDATYRRSLVLHEGKPVPVPEGFQLLAPTQLKSLWNSPLFTLPGKLRMALEYFIPRRRNGGDESLADFVRRRFGTEALERLIQPLVGGIYTSDPEKLSLKATMPRFIDMEQEYGSLIRAMRKGQASADHDPTASGARYGLFATLQGGMGELLDTLEAKVREQATVHLETTVAAVIPESGRKGFLLTLKNGGRETFDGVVIALPAYRAADTISNFAVEAANQLRKIEYASTAIVVTGHRLDEIQHKLDAFGLVVPAIENRRILAVSFTSRKFPHRAPPERVMLRTFVGGAMQPDLFHLSDAELTQLVHEELNSLFGVQAEPDFTLIARWQRAMPQYHVGHLDLLSRVENDMTRYPQVALAGNAYHGVGVPDCIHSGEQGAERVWRTLSP